MADSVDLLRVYTSPDNAEEIITVVYPGRVPKADLYAAIIGDAIRQVAATYEVPLPELLQTIVLFVRESQDNPALQPRYITPS